MSSGPRPVTREDRLSLARELVNRILAVHGANVLGITLYGSTARGADGPYSDVQLYAALRRPVEPAAFRFIYTASRVQLDLIPVAQLLKRAARVGPAWPVEADQYRHLAPVYDPLDIFSRVQQAAANPPREAFRAAIQQLLVRLYDRTGKLRNARERADDAGIRLLAGALAWDAAMLVGLANRTSYESAAAALPRSLGLPLLPDGYPALAGLLITGEVADVRRLYLAAEELWAGLDRFAASLSIPYRTDELPL